MEWIHGHKKLKLFITTNKISFLDKIRKIGKKV